MNMNALPLVAALALTPMVASAGIGNAETILGGSLKALQGAGFEGIHDIPVPSALPAVAAFRVAARADETAEALAALTARTSILDGNGSAIGETVRKLGFAFDGDEFPTKNFSSDGNNFAVTSYRGKVELILQEVLRVDGKKRLRSCLLSADGTLQAAAVTRKENGRFIADAVPPAEAQAPCRALLDFWVQYYRDNLKKPGA